MKQFDYEIHLEPAVEGGYTVTVPALPAIVTEGDTCEEALAMAHEAIALYLDYLEAKRVDIEDLIDVKKRRGEPTIPHEKVIQNLLADGYLIEPDNDAQ